MTKQTGYLAFRKTKVSKVQIAKRLKSVSCNEKYYKNTSVRICFHDRVTYNSKEDAYSAIINFDNDNYNNHAVLYKECRTLYWLVKYEYYN